MPAGRISVNGRARELDAANVGELLVRLGLGADAPGVAVALNGEVLRRAEWDETILQSGDAIDIVGAVQGG